MYNQLAFFVVVHSFSHLLSVIPAGWHFEKGGQESVTVDRGSLLAFQLAKPKMSFSAKWAMILSLYCHCIIFEVPVYSPVLKGWDTV